MSHLIVTTWLRLAPGAFAFSGTDTGDTGTTAPTDTTTTTDSGDATTDDTQTTTVDSGCVDCLGAADLAGEEGGRSCSTASLAGGSWLGLLALPLLRRRR